MSRCPTFGNNGSYHNYNIEEIARIEKSLYCETEHFLIWGVLLYSKSGLVARMSEYFVTDGRLRYLESPTNDDFTVFVNRIEDFFYAFFYLDEHFI